MPGLRPGDLLRAETASAAARVLLASVSRSGGQVTGEWGDGVTDLQDHLTEAAAAAIADVMPAIEAEPRRVRVVTIELEVADGRRVTGGTAWIERRVNLGKLLGVGRG